MDLREWLLKLGLERYEPVFRDNNVDAALLPSLTAEDLKDLGVTLVGDRRRLLQAIASLREEGEVAVKYPEPARSPKEAEWRQLSVVFVDLVGSTALSGRLDPEEYRGLIILQISYGRRRRFGSWAHCVRCYSITTMVRHRG